MKYRHARLVIVGSTRRRCAAGPPERYAHSPRCDRAATAVLDPERMKRGVCVIPGVRRFVSVLDTEIDMAQTTRALERACQTIRAGA